MKNLKLFLVLLLSSLMILSGCSSYYFYPSDLSDRYCYYNYTELSYTYICTKKYVNSIGVYTHSGNEYEFYGIPGISPYEFLVCESDNLLMSSPETHLYRAIDCDIDPLADFKYSEMRLGYYANEKNDKDAFYISSDPSMLEQLKDALNNQCITYEYSGLQEYEAVRIGGWAGELLVLQLSFEDTDNILWQATVEVREGVYYLCLDDCTFAPLPDELQKLVASLVEQGVLFLDCY